MDITKPFFIAHPIDENGYIVYEYNQPNDIIGEFAFEYDNDGSQRKKWNKHIAELEHNGTKGDLVYHKVSMKYNPVFDISNESVLKPLVSHSFIIFDTSK